MRLIGLLDQKGWFYVSGLSFCTAILVVGLTGCGNSNTPPPPAPPEVEVMTATPQDVPVFEQWIGALDGSTNAQIRAQVSGYLTTQKYSEGGVVKKGDVLFQIDKRVFQAALDQANAQVDVANAQLVKTGLDVTRLTPLLKEKAVSQEELDDAVQANLAAKASVEAAKATAAQAKLNLDFTDIVSPIDGIAGTAQAQIGDLVGPGTSVLTTVSTVDPIRVYFSMSEQSYLAFCEHFTNAAERGAYRDGMDLQLILSDGSKYPLPGKWLFTSRQVDVNTGTLQVAGLFPNPNFVLRPGQYGQVRAQTDLRHQAILLPQRAVAQMQGAYQVAIVDADNKVHIKTVQVGDQTGDEWLINSGVDPNDQVIIEGAQKVKEGTVVAPKPYEVQAKKA